MIISPLCNISKTGKMCNAEIIRSRQLSYLVLYTRLGMTGLSVMPGVSVDDACYQCNVILSR